MMAPLLPPPPDVAVNLAMAVIASSNAPLVLLDGDLTVMAASLSFCRAFAIDPAQVAGRRIDQLGAGEWNSPDVSTLLAAAARGDADIEDHEMDLVRPGRPTRRLVLNARKLTYDDAGQVRLLLSVSDVTEARVAERVHENMLREKAMLLQELQHRVANSLQIIASVLLQSARRVQSDETRSHLQAAHQRVMSVAAVQKQLAASSMDDVSLSAYFIDLCQSLGASMIRDHDVISLEVRADDTVTTAVVSVSLGLIVTELVINALKHAFPGDRGGKIVVAYRSDGPEWTLSVDDDGIGMGNDPTQIKSGLGTSIVIALAKQLHARVDVRDRDPGTSVSVAHIPGAAVTGSSNGFMSQAAV